MTRRCRDGDASRQRSTPRCPAGKPAPGAVDPASGLCHARDIELDLVVIGGAGHVGLPLSLAFASTGLRVGIYDIDDAALARIRGGHVPFQERGADALLTDMLREGRLELSSKPEMLSRTNTLIFVIGTPIDEFLNPKLTVFREALAKLASHVRDGALVVLRSTVFPGTTELVAEVLREHSKRVDVAFCPERIVEGQALEELRSLPEIIGADTPEAGDRAEALFRRLAPSTVRVSIREAEVAKLLTNTWRYMKFAVANQFFMLTHSAGIDYENVLRAIRQDYPRAKDLPGPGFAAGPCLLKDTMQLAAFSADRFPLGHSAMQINEGLPSYVVAAMERRFGTLRGRNVGVLGMAFKAESDDPRASLSFKLRRLLLWAGAQVLCTDPYVRDDRLVPLDRVLAESEILVIGVPHRAYRDVQLPAERLVDIWGAAGRISL